MRIHGATAEFLTELKTLGYSGFPPTTSCP